MGSLSTNLSRHEMACRCGCGFNTVDVLLVEMIQRIVDAFKTRYGWVSLEVTGPNRCAKHNHRIGGAPNSLHKEAKAMDFRLWMKYDHGGDRYQIEPQEVYDFIDTSWPDTFGVGIYDDRVHFDVRPRKARWDKRILEE